MRKRYIMVFIASMVFCTSFSNFQTTVKAADLNNNLIVNGTFDTDLNGWNSGANEDGIGNATFEDGVIKVQVTTCGSVAWGIQVYQDGFKLYKNGKYHLEFDISSTADRTIGYRIQQNGGAYTGYAEDKVKITKDVQTVSKDFTMTSDNDMAPRLVFNLGNIAGENLNPHDIKIDNVKLVLVDGAGIDSSGETPKVELNTNLIPNGNFDTSLAGWGNFTTDGGVGAVSLENGALKAQVDDCGNVAWSMQVFYDGFKMYKNAKYRLEFDVSSTIDRTIEYAIQLNRGDYSSYAGGKVNTTNEVQTVSNEFTMNYDDDSSPRLAFNIGNVAGKLDPHSIKIDNVKLILLDDTGADIPDETAKVEQKIVLNQVGYKPDDKKKVVFRAETEDSKFRVVSTETEKIVYEGEISGSTYNEAAKETDRVGDFSSVKTPGTYKIETDSLGSSYEFTIGKDVYNDVFKDAVRFFYFQRCGQELTEDLAGKWSHPACHTDLATIYGTDKKIDVSGGWHDAGDYGRYVVASSKAIADLLSAYGDNKAAFGDDFNIPESGNRIPDVLDEVKYQLEWMLKMQEPVSGGVYHKVTGANFPGYIMPDKETDELIVSPISTTATADFAAIMAMGYENFKDIDPSLAEKYLAAGEKAWNYLEITPNSGGFKNPEGITTGEYGDTDDSDERYWAAAQLFKATGSSKYNEAFKTIANTEIKTGYDWISVGNYGNMAYLSAKGADQNVSAKIKKYVTDEAQKIVDIEKNDVYNNSNGINYQWGSDMQVTNDAILLTNAYEIIPNQEYLEDAKEGINYCFGKNSLGKSFITGYGSDYVKNPHHRPSIAKNEAVPGMIVGGPNEKLEDSVAKGNLEGQPPAKCYIDNSESYSTNEVDIYWNSALVHAMAEVNRNFGDGNQTIPNGQTQVTTVASVRITGTERVGNTLSAELTGENGSEFTTSSAVTYKWYRLSSKNSENGTLVGDNTTYKLVGSDKGQYIKLVVSYDDKEINAITRSIASSSSSNSSSSSTSDETTKTNDQTTATNTNSTAPIEGWNENSKDWKYIENGQPVTGWNQINGSWYLMDSTGIMQNGWRQTNGEWYLLKDNGAMATGWQQSNGEWYLLKDNGAMAIGWQQTNDEWYYLYSDGAMASNTIIDGYALDANGVWVK